MPDNPQRPAPGAADICQLQSGRLKQIEHILHGNGQAGVLHRLSSIEQKTDTIITIGRWLITGLIMTGVSLFGIFATHTIQAIFQ